MPSLSQYPGFHKNVTKAYLVIICALAVSLPILNLLTDKPSIKQIIVIIVFVIISYVVYWLIVRLNCYGTPPERRTGRDSISNNNNNSNSNNNNTSTIYTQPPRSNSSSSTHSSSNGTNNHHPTFANYRLGRLAEIFRRLGGNSTANDDEISCETGEVLRPPPPTYNTALEGAGLPPPYMNDPIDIVVNNSESQQMSERYVPPRRPVPSVPSSSSLRRPAPPIPQQQSSTQSIQDTSQESSSITSDSLPRRPVPSIPQLSGRSVPPIPTSSSISSSIDNSSQSPRRPVPPVPATSSSALPPKLYKSISHDSNINNNRK